jgi:hypothetical protein
MATGNSYIPTKDSVFDAWFRVLSAYIAKMVFLEKGAWTHIPTAALEQLLAAFEAWHKAYEAILGPHTAVETEVKKEMRKNSEGLIRPFKRRYLDDLPVTDADRVAMGLPIRDVTHTPGKKPDSIPQAEVDSSKIRQLGIHFWDEGAANRAKPHGAHGAECRWNMQEEAPLDIESELFHSDFDTASPFTLVFREADRGKRIYFALRWESHTNLKGEWSEIYSAIVP